jgi:hypothetical protein
VPAHIAEMVVQALVVQIFDTVGFRHNPLLMPAVFGSIFRRDYRASSTNPEVASEVFTSCAPAP